MNKISCFLPYAGKEQVELLDMKKDGIVLAEYWTDLPPKDLLQQKLHSALIEAQNRLASQKHSLSDHNNL